MTDIEFYQYLIHFVVMMTILVAMAIYLLVSKRNAFGRELVTDQRLRRKAGWAILIYVFTYLAYKAMSSRVLATPSMWLLS